MTSDSSSKFIMNLVGDLKSLPPRGNTFNIFTIPGIPNRNCEDLSRRHLIRSVTHGDNTHTVAMHYMP